MKLIQNLISIAMQLSNFAVNYKVRGRDEHYNTALKFNISEGYIESRGAASQH